MLKTLTTKAVITLAAFSDIECEENIHISDNEDELLASYFKLPESYKMAV